MIALFEEATALSDNQDTSLGLWLLNSLTELWTTEETPTAALPQVDDFQLKILQFLVTILLVNLVGIYFAWRVYGPKISERLMRPISAKVFEELKSGAKELKLPAEHSPRI